ncbi:hypothetical protein GCM10010302_17010 [Streptomyces polychromogenes]|uniref:Uncharacterized protein n=1 Tax=Streptomyces polychromogenes TaxID=67342 RepID=A0ABN0V7R6_9ACTN
MQWAMASRDLSSELPAGNGLGKATADGLTARPERHALGVSVGPVCAEVPSALAERGSGVHLRLQSLIKV